ncbi:uncharacterized protein LOC133188002 [Saccostrea echinata]|uniref:uncharacterized protein LOC133188002 n=1 Tax=Saccostrea echinata TaxID=191078 RepID=UPI002A7FC512|nr:uncharacterized protein LOC133188002 [Saccostrea echinata]
MQWIVRRKDWVLHDGMTLMKNINLGKMQWIVRREDEFIHNGTNLMTIFLKDVETKFDDIIFCPWIVDYSVNKHKRWTLSSWIQNNIEALSKEDFRIVLSERENVHFWNKWFWNDCVLYVDNKTPLPVVKPTKSASYFWDLQRKCLGGDRIEKNIAVRKKKRHNLHSRGIQRKSELLKNMEKIDNRKKYDVEQLREENDRDEDVTEFRYEVSTPGKLSRFFLRHGNYSTRYMFKGAREFFKYPAKNALFKQKGFVNGKLAILSGKKSLEDESSCIKKEISNYGFSENTCLANNFYQSDEVLIVYDFEKDEVCRVKKETTLQVFLSDCLKIIRRKPKFRKTRTRQTIQKSPDLQRKNHIIYMTDYKEKTELDKENTCFNSHPEKPSKDFAFCKSVPTGGAILSFKKTEMNDFLQGISEICSTNVYPSIYVISVEKLFKKEGVKGSNHSTFCHESDLFNIDFPVLVVQEIIDSAMSSEYTGISRYRLIVLDNEKFSARKLDDMILQNFRNRISSVDDIFRFAKELMSLNSNARPFFTSCEKERPSFESYVMEPAYDWLRRVPYRITTVKQAYMNMLECCPPKHYQRKMNKLPTFLHSVTQNSAFEFECRVCFASLYGGEDSTGGLIILPCQHPFCRNCLYRYAVENIRTSTRFISCLEYKCTSKIDPLIIMSLVPIQLFCKWIQRQQEQMVMSSGIWKWCPNNTCDFILSLVPNENISPKSVSNKKRMGVKCLCKTEFCLECCEQPHWPATCQQIKAYVKVLDITKDVLQQIDTTKTFTVNVKTCPHCNLMVEKASKKCNYGMCICGNYFCWFCLKDLNMQCTRVIPTKQIDLVNTKQLKFGVKYLDQAYEYELVCILQSMKIMEKIFVSISDIPRKSPPGKEFNSLASQVDFIFSRTSELLERSDIADNKVRIDRLHSSLSENIKTMALMSVYLQQRKLQQKNITFDHWIRY